MLIFCVIFLPEYLVRIKKSCNFAVSKGTEMRQKAKLRPKTKNIALWCNGSTPDSGSVCESSSLSKATLKPIHQPDRFSFY